MVVAESCSLFWLVPSLSLLCRAGRAILVEPVRHLARPLSNWTLRFLRRRSHRSSR